MSNINLQEENTFKKTIDLILINYKFFVVGVGIALVIAFLENRYATPTYKITSSILIQESKEQSRVEDVVNQKLFGKDQILQNELKIMQSYPVIEQTVKNLDLCVNYFTKGQFKIVDAYKSVPFKILYQQNHIQPINTLFEINLQSDGNIEVKAESKKVTLYNFAKERKVKSKENWKFDQKSKVGKLIENGELSFIVEFDSTKMSMLKDQSTYYFSFMDNEHLTIGLKKQIQYDIVDKLATVIEISMFSSSPQKGIDILSGVMNVYAQQNLAKKNHNSEITIDFIEKQLGEISDSLSQSEKKLQTFLSNKQIMNINDQAMGVSTQYRDLKNQRAELTTKKKYYEYVEGQLTNEEGLTNLLLPSSMGITDQTLNNLMAELISTNSKRAALYENKQEKSPLIKQYTIQIDNLKKTISENITYVRRTTDIALDELNKRINKAEAEISNLPETQRQLGGIERKYHYNETMNNYLKEKLSEAKIAKASNLPDVEIVEPAVAIGPVSPNPTTNYIFALLFGLAIPYGFLWVRSNINNKIVSQEDIEQLTELPVLGKIPHNKHKTNNVMFEHAKSSISEAYRILRTNLEYYVRGGHKKVIMVSSSIEGEGKSFNSLNIAMSYAQFDRKTVLVDFDMRKYTNYFNREGESLVGLSSYLINKANLEDIVIKSPHEYLDYIPSGPIPPNPVELIGLELTEKLINHLKNHYDYIILDTPPLAQVTDAYLLIDYADVKILILRYNYTLKKIFSFIMKDIKQKGIKNFCIVLNDNKIFGEQYGYEYGYKKTHGKRKLLKDNKTKQI